MPVRDKILTVLHGLLTRRLYGDMTFDNNPTGVATMAARSLLAEARGVPGLCAYFHCRRAQSRHAGALHRRLFPPQGWNNGAGGGSRLGRGARAGSWLGRLDPANGISATDAHVRVAVGLDYLGAAPVRGTRHGGGGRDPCRWRCASHRAGGRRRTNDCCGFYSITWSARVSSVGGSVRPSALAVLRLMTSWNLVAS